MGGASYILGAFIYAIRFPERLKPEVFCYAGNSHNIFHVMVLGGFFLHFIGSIEAYNFRLENACPA